MVRRVERRLHLRWTVELLGFAEESLQRCICVDFGRDPGLAEEVSCAGRERPKDREDITALDNVWLPRTLYGETSPTLISA